MPNLIIKTNDRELFFDVVQDSSLLPRRCREVLIDMYISSQFLPADDVETIRLRISEGREATHVVQASSPNYGLVFSKTNSRSGQSLDQSSQLRSHTQQPSFEQSKYSPGLTDKSV
jgi:hypothetical protein